MQRLITPVAVHVSGPAGHVHARRGIHELYSPRCQPELVKAGITVVVCELVEINAEATPELWILFVTKPWAWQVCMLQTTAVTLPSKTSQRAGPFFSLCILDQGIFN